ncbi:hypothetical protein EH230_04800 [Flavobacterium columnare]|uniref:Uncharacterized protein n=1 Tax=Flavobacterium columnare TaxID=996 RepID=A0A437U9I6_9FLAO|nr:hypothetical protein [Flavobacterium columnare]RVU90272.1 hypothetical protein EH230_04800 [Flavobacterium columnare]
MIKFFLHTILSVFCCSMGFSQKNDSVPIEDYVITFDKSKLSKEFDHLKNNGDLTFLKSDFNGDGKVDFCAFFTGIENVVMITSDSKNKGEIVFNQNLDDTWFKDDKFATIMLLLKKGKKVKNLITGKNIKLNYNSVHIIKLDKTEYIITVIDNSFRFIRIK